MSNQFEGMRSLLSNLTTQEQKPLTLQDFDNFMQYLGSDEYAAQFREQEKHMAEADILLAKAWEQGIITEAEYICLYESIGINRALIVSPKMAERLKQVRG